MSLKNIITNNELEHELKHNINNINSNVDTAKVLNKKEVKKEIKKEIKKHLKFDISLINTDLYKNHLILIIIYFFICVIYIPLGDIFSLLTVIFMFLLIVFLSSNPFKIENNRFLDVGISNLIKSLNMILKNFKLIRLNNIHHKIIQYFTKLFTISLLLSGIPAFNISFILISIGLWLSYCLSFINKDIDGIKKSCEQIQKYEILYISLSTIFFSLFFKGSVVNATLFTHLALLKYFYSSIENFQINEINRINQKDF